MYKLIIFLYTIFINKKEIMNYYKKRLSVNLPMEIHKEVELLAEKYDISISRLILSMVIERLNLESSYNNPQ